MPLTPERLRRAMTAIIGGGSLDVALLCGASECRVGGYKRQAASFVQDGGAATNVAELRFGPYEDGWPGELTGWVAYEGASEVGRGTCTPRTPEAGSISVFMPGDLAIRVA